jgi:hypothetical protein
VTAQVQSVKTREGLRRTAVAVRQASRAILLSAVTAAQESAKSTTLFKDHPGSKTKTRDTIKAKAFPDSGQVVARGAAIFLENGTKPHEISARSGGMLRFFANGQAVFRRRVQHPGTKATHFMGLARAHAEHVVGYAAEIYLNEAIARA